MIAGLCYAGGAIWGIVEGVDYFVNQNIVNWWFLAPILGGMAIAVANVAAIMKK